MKIKINLLFLFFVVLLSGCLSFELREGFKSFKRETAGRTGSSTFRHRPPHNPKRHSWKRGPHTGIYDGTPYHHGGHRRHVEPSIHDFYPSWLYASNCSRGCGHIGNGAVGCLNPSNLPDSCIFASDCIGC